MFETVTMTAHNKYVVCKIMKYPKLPIAHTLFSPKIIFKQIIHLIMDMVSVDTQELEVRSLYHLHSLKTKSSRCHYIVMTRSETKLSVAIPAPVSGQSAVNVATATSKCSITFLLPYDQDGDVKNKTGQYQIYFKSI